MTLIVDHGEVRNVRILVSNKKGDEFQIYNARYEMEKTDNYEILQSEECKIDGHVISAMISVQDTGVYSLKFIYQIGNETLVDVVEVVSL